MTTCGQRAVHRAARLASGACRARQRAAATRHASRAAPLQLPLPAREAGARSARPAKRTLGCRAPDGGGDSATISHPRRRREPRRRGHQVPAEPPPQCHPPTARATATERRRSRLLKQRSRQMNDVRSMSASSVGESCAPSRLAAEETVQGLRTCCTYPWAAASTLARTHVRTRYRRRRPGGADLDRRLRAHHRAHCAALRSGRALPASNRRARSDWAAGCVFRSNVNAKIAEREHRDR